MSRMGRWAEQWEKVHWPTCHRVMGSLRDQCYWSPESVRGEGEVAEVLRGSLQMLSKQPETGERTSVLHLTPNT